MRSEISRTAVGREHFPHFLPFFCGKVSFEARKQFIHDFLLPIIQDDRLFFQAIKKGLFFQGAVR